MKDENDDSQKQSFALQHAGGSFAAGDNEGNEREAKARRFLDAAREAFADGNIIKAYPLWRKAMKAHGLPLDWFSTERPAGESLHLRNLER